MCRVASSRHAPLGLSGAILLALGCNGSYQEERRVGAEIIVVRLPEAHGALQRPPVEFNHAEHAKEMQKDGCTVCHPEGGPGRLSLKLGRTDDSGGRDALIETYHGRCIGCHERRTTKNRKAGPPARSGPRTCGGCHVQRPTPTSARGRVAFTYALHDAHVKVAEEKCETCHAFYDKAQKRFVYREGVDGGCGDFHSSRDPKRLRELAHSTCVSCHRQRTAPGQKTGPTDCRGCHEARAAGKRPEKTPRLVANQPERSWIKAAGAKSRLVGFDHRGHEVQAPFCSTCHHKTLKACKDCHTLVGSVEGQGVTMASAYHLPSSAHSCVGCHQRQLAAADCAGCHERRAALPGRDSCVVCHRGPQPDKDVAAPATMPAAEGEVKLAELPPSSADFPDKVEIKLLASSFKPSTMPHRKIVARLDAAIRGNKLASTFHGKVETLCSGCHHRSPAGARPPPCEACHGKVDHPTKDQPALMAAFHRQCIGCHQRMGLKQGCTDCHTRAAKEGGR